MSYSFITTPMVFVRELGEIVGEGFHLLTEQDTHGFKWSTNLEFYVQLNLSNPTPV